MKKNIMFIIGNLKSGGAEKVINNLCNNLKDKYNITLVLRENINNDYHPDVNVIVIPELYVGGKMIIGIKKLKKIKKDLKIDTSVSFLIKYNVFNGLSRNKEKIIFSIRNLVSSQKHIHSRKMLFMYKLLVRKADLIVNVSQAAKNDNVKNYKCESKNIVIPNFCDCNYIEEAMKDDLLEKHKEIFKGKVIICPGRYSDQKGQWHLIRAFNEVIKYDKEAKLVLLGRGPLKDYYESLVKEYGLEENVYILDFVNNIYKYMAHSNILVLNSFFEGMPNVILEALACSLPVIATDSPGGTREILAPEKNGEYVKDISLEKYGVLMPICNGIKYNANQPLTNEEKKIAEAIILLMKNKELYLKYKQAAKERIKDYEKDKILKMWERVL